MFLVSSYMTEQNSKTGTEKKEQFLWTELQDDYVSLESMFCKV